LEFIVGNFFCRFVVKRGKKKKKWGEGDYGDDYGSDIDGDDDFYYASLSSPTTHHLI